MDFFQANWLIWMIKKYVRTFYIITHLIKILVRKQFYISANIKNNDNHYFEINFPYFNYDLLILTS